MELTTKNWKEFRIEDLFDYERGKEAAPNQNQHGECPLISEAQDNNGFVRLVEPTKVIDGHCLTVSVNFASTVFYQEENFCASVNIIILRPKSEMTKKQLLFIGSILSKKHKVYSYTDKVSKVLLMKETLLLPSKNDEPDWDFMEEFIKEIEEKYILNVDKYNQENVDKALSITGLTMVDLDDDLKVEPADRYEEFRVGDLFEINSSKKIYHANQITIYDKQTEGAYPYIVRSENNRGIRGFIKESEDNLNDHMTLSFAQDTFVAYFQPFKYFTGNKVKILKPKYDINENMFLYLETAINKAIQSFSWGSGSTEDTIRDIKITLPAIDEDTPDFDYMEKAIYIYIYIKKVIKSWKMDNEKEIRVLKSVTNK